MHKDDAKSAIHNVKIVQDHQLMIALFVQKDFIFQNLFKDALNAIILVLHVQVQKIMNVLYAIKGTLKVMIKTFMKSAISVNLDAMIVRMRKYVRVVLMVFI